jgi:tripartite ATP-independent transporter DctP family solute receptor
MKKALAALVLSALAVSLAQAQAIELKLGHFASEAHPGSRAGRMFAEGVAKRTEGQVRVTLYPDNVLGSPPEVLKQSMRGDLDMALPSQGQLGLHLKKFNCVMLPFIFENHAHADKVIDGPFTAWAAPDLEKIGLVFLANWEWGFRNLTNSKRPVNAPVDVRGLVVRTPPGLPYRAAMEALGAIVAAVDFNDLHKALKEGVVDAEENPVAVIFSNRIYEFHKHLAMTGHNYNSMVHVINKKVWDKLSAGQQTILREESLKAGLWMRQAVREAEAEQLDKMRAAGVQVTYPDRERFKALMKPAYDRMNTLAGEENIREFARMAAAAK